LFNNRPAHAVEHFALPAEQALALEADANPKPSTIQ
jgi:hypothetical protein